MYATNHQGRPDVGATTQRMCFMHAAADGTPTQAIEISGVRPGYGYQFSGTPSSDVGPYGRSVTYMPQTPVMPPNFR